MSAQVWIAGSISNHPPFFFGNVENSKKHDSTAYLADGWPVPAIEKENYLEQGKLLKEGGVDFLILEMVKDMAHGEVVCDAAQQSELPVFLGLTTKICADGVITLRGRSISKYLTWVVHPTVMFRMGVKYIDLVSLMAFLQTR